MPDGVFNREADNLRPLLAIASVAGGEWPERTRNAAVASHVAEGDDSASRLELLLGDVRDIFTASDPHLERISSADLVERLVEIEGRPWAEYGSGGKPITANKLARLFKSVGIAPQLIRSGKDVWRGYFLHQFGDAFERFLPEGGAEPLHRYKCDEISTSEPSQTVTPDSSVTVQKCEKPNNDGLCNAVTVAKGGNGQNTCVQCKGAPDGAERLCLVDGAEVWLHRECERFYRERWR
jgi:hypothetical protein